MAQDSQSTQNPKVVVKASDSPEPPQFEDVVTALLQVDPTGITGKRRQSEARDDGEQQS